MSYKYMQRTVPTSRRAPAIAMDCQTCANLAPRRVQARALRSYACPLRLPAGVRFIPVHRATDCGVIQRDIPMLDLAWTIVNGYTGMAVGKVRARRRPLGRAWDYFNVYYILSNDPGTPPNEALRLLGRLPHVRGEFLVVRRSPGGRRLLDIREMDIRKAVGLVRRIVRILRSAEQRSEDTRTDAAGAHVATAPL
ncbi:hypothetical protein OH77DRAFT_1428797 [Trametes cingulata]|nr:hypothetical protein OH77DRAFT_1428797 [Trametes cingulata]